MFRKKTMGQKKTNTQKKSVILAYIPVLHAGYTEFIMQYRTSDTLYIFNHLLVSELKNNAFFEEGDLKKIEESIRYLKKEIRALPLKQMQSALQVLFPKLKVKQLSAEDIIELQSAQTTIVTPDEDVTRSIVGSFFSNNPVSYSPIFLRWNRKNLTQHFEVHPDVKVEQSDFSKKIAKICRTEAEKATDWWRQVGAVLIKDGKIIDSTHNTHLPTEYQPYSDGDPRNCSHKGEYLDLYTAIHAEAKLIANAAKNGMSLDRTELYVTLFPCPVCAKLIAESGIKKLYFSQGYGMLDGVRVLKASGVEIVLVKE